ncbi:hypothetical protein R3Q06_32670 [Rhodococcus erythropolis]|uniref:YncE family protein n=1 Tax=Rhodococcus erythropolis TaxID=1833 RepID=UPI0029492642|nr:hypothetical protein [Rhodococcus erythropolis]MDV6278221.1 hypothetical protein [Rhodococcus erythropolis]
MTKICNTPRGRTKDAAGIDDYPAKVSVVAGAVVMSMIGSRSSRLRAAWGVWMVCVVGLCAMAAGVPATADTVVATVPVGNGPVAVAVTPDGGRAYVTNGSDKSVSVIDTATDTVVDTVPVGAFPAGVAITPDGARTYVTNGSDKSVSVIEIATDTVLATVPVGAFPARWPSPRTGPASTSPTTSTARCR